MANNRTTNSSYEDHEIAGHSVRIGRAGGIEQLLIDGHPSRFRKTDPGYVLHANAYAEPQKTPLDAVKLYLERPDD